ncbi:hypothetical protein MXB_4623, partial [Myxobolus squamalis]
LDTKKPKSKKQSARVGLVKKIAGAQQEMDKIKKLQEEEERKFEEERQKEIELQKLEDERKERKKQKEKERKQRLKQDGKLLSRFHKDKKNKDQEILKRMLQQGATCAALNDQSNSLAPHKPIILSQLSTVSSEFEKIEKIVIKSDPHPIDISTNNVKFENDICEQIVNLQIKQKPLISDPVLRIETLKQQNVETDSHGLLRSPIICVLGHVDTGKTKVLDKLRNTHVQDGEAGGITQQIGVTNVPFYAIKESTKNIPDMSDFDFKITGLSIIDTPGHFSFRNLRSLGSSLCDMAILIVDIMHAIEPQTEESIKLLLNKKTPFVVALNKIDLIVGWKSIPGKGIEETLELQSVRTKQHFDDLFRKTFTKFAELGLNLALYFQKKSHKLYIPAIPTSALTGDGIGDLIGFICRYSQEYLTKRLAVSKNLEAALLTPQPLKEMRVKGIYIHHESMSVSQGVKIAGPNLDAAIAGFPLFVAQYDDEIDYYKNELSNLLTKTFNSFDKKDKGADQFRHLAIFPCSLKILPQHVFKTRDPIIIGVTVEEGTARIGTPLCVPSKDNIVIGIIAGIEINHKSMDIAKKGQEASIKIANLGNDAPKMLGRHFEITDLLVSKITRDSIDIMKDYFREELSKQDWILIKNLKSTFSII